LADIFFSYSRRDVELVEPIVLALEDRSWSVWWDADVDGGESWSDVIEAELKRARCVIVAWSAQSSKSEWVREEARIANSARKLAPILLETIDPPFGFGGIQTVDMSRWKGNRQAPEFLRLCAAIQRKLDVSASTNAPESSSIRPGTQSPSVTSRRASNEPLTDDRPTVELAENATAALAAKIAARKREDKVA
jgi:TIR domain-containing protein